MLQPQIRQELIPGPHMDFAVLSRTAMERFAPAAPHILISIASPHPAAYRGKDRPLCLPECPARLAVLKLQFDDYDYGHQSLGAGALTMESGHAPVFFSREHAVAIRDFAAAYAGQVRLMVCHCEAGISRSPAVAAALSHWFNSSDAALRARCPGYNRLVYDTLAAVLASPPAADSLDAACFQRGETDPAGPPPARP